MTNKQSITASVGRAGSNRDSDVRVVQGLLNMHLSKLLPLKPLVVNGHANPETINAIEHFQRLVVNLQRPDGRVDPNGRTWMVLNQTMHGQLSNSASLEAALAALKTEAINFGTRFIQDSEVRQGYIRETEKYSKLIAEEVRLGRLTAEQGAEEANRIRNAIMEASRVRSSDLGRAQAEVLKGKGLTLKVLEEKYAQKIFNQKFDALSQSQKNQVWLKIVESAGRANPSVNAKTAKLAKAGRGLVFVSVAISVYNVSTAEDKGRQVVKEGVTSGAGILGGMAGGAAAGLACGPGAPVCVTLGVFVGGAAAALGADFAFDWLW